jgi:hypothetical protein
MATWKAIRSSSQDRSQDKQLDIEQAFRAKWLHGRIFGEGEAAISCRLFPPCTFLISLMTEGAVASLPARGSPCSSPQSLHPNGYFSRDSRVGVLKSR